jgi:ribosomal protein S4
LRRRFRQARELVSHGHMLGAPVEGVARHASPGAKLVSHGHVTVDDPREDIPSVIVPRAPVEGVARHASPGAMRSAVRGSDPLSPSRLLVHIIGVIEH